MPPTRLPAPAALLMMGWLTVVLLVDSRDSHPTQRLLGLATWAVLGIALTRVTPTVRAQTLVVVGFATLVEFLASPTLHVYLYRFHNVPMYVPPGHGLVYLSAFALGHAGWVERRLHRWAGLVVTLGGAWAVYGLLTPRHDVLGALWYLCLLGFLRWGPSRQVYVGAFVVVSYLELVGTRLGTWTWSLHDPTGLVSIGNPPSGAAGGYGWFDLVGLLLAPYVVRWVTRRPGRPARVDAH
ncbi:MAG: hypothetical protein ACRDPI_03245 [Nocardioidaceae bacterium]